MAFTNRELAQLIAIQRQKEGQGNILRVIPVSGVTPQLVVPTVLPSGILPVSVTNPISATVSVPQPLQVSGIVAIQQPLPTLPSGIVSVNISGGVIPSGIQPVAITGPISASVSIPQPLQVSGILGISPLPVPVSGVTPQLVVPTVQGSGIVPVNVVNPITTNVSIPQPLQVSGIVAISPLPVPVSGVTPQLVVPTVIPSGIQPVAVINPITTTISIPQPLQVSGIVGISPLPVPVSGVTPQLVVPTVLASGITPVSIVAGSVTTTISQPLQVSGIVAISPLPVPVSGVTPFSVNVSGIVQTFETNIPVPVSGVTPQLVVPTVQGSGIVSVVVINPLTATVTISQPLQVSGIVGISPLPLPVSGVTPQLVTQTNIPTFITISGVVSGTGNFPVMTGAGIALRVSGVVSLAATALPIPVSGVYLPPINIATNPVPVSGVVPQLVVPTVIGSGVQPVSIVAGSITAIISQPLQVSGIVAISPSTLPVSGVTPQLVVPTVVGSGIIPVSIVAGTLTASIGGTIATSGVVPQLVVPTTLASGIQSVNVINALTTTISQPLQVSGIIAISPSPLPVSGVTPQLVVPTVLASGISPVSIVGGSVTASISTPLQVSGIVAISPSPLTVSGIVGLVQPISVLPSGIQSVNITNTQISISGIVGFVQPIAVIPSGIVSTFEANVPLSVSPSGIQSVNVINTTLPVSGATPQLVTQTNVPTFINISGVVGAAAGAIFRVQGITSAASPIYISGVVGIAATSLPIPVSGVYLPAINIATNPVPVSGITPQLVVPTVVGSGITPVSIVAGSLTTTIAQPLQVSGIIAISPSTLPVSIAATVATSGVVPQLVVPTVLGSGVQPVSIVGGSVTTIISTPLQVSGIIAISPSPLPVSGITPQLVVPTVIGSGIQPVAIITPISISQPLQVSGIVSISPIPLPVSGVTPQLVYETNVPLPVSGVTPQLVSVSSTIPVYFPSPSGAIYLQQLPIALGQRAIGASLSVVVSSTQPPISGIVNIGAASLPIPVSGVYLPPISILTNPVPVSGITPQLVVPTVIGSGIQPVAITTPISVSIPQPLQVSGIVSLSPIPLPVSGVTPQLTVPLTIPSGILPVAITGPFPIPVSGIVGLVQPIAVSGITPQLVVPTVIGSGIQPVAVTAPISVTITQPLQVSGIVAISPSTLPVSGVTPQLVVPTVLASGIQPVALVSSITQLTTVSGILPVSLISPSTLPVSGVTPQLVVPTVVPSGIQPVNITGPLPLTVSGIVGLIQPIQVSGIVGLSGAISVTPSGIQSVNIINSVMPVSGIVGLVQPISTTVSGIISVNVTGPSPLTVSGIVGLVQPIAVSGIVPQLTVPLNIPSGILPVNVTGPSPLSVTITPLGQKAVALSLSVVQATTAGAAFLVSGVSKSQFGLADDLGNAFQPYTGASAAPADGVWTFAAVTPMSSGITVTPVGSTGYYLVPTVYPTISGIMYTFKYPVVKATTYNVSGTVISGWVGPA